MSDDNERAVRFFGAPSDLSGGLDALRARRRRVSPAARSPDLQVPVGVAGPERQLGMVAAVAILALTLGINLFAMVPPLAVLLLLDQSVSAATHGNMAILLIAVATALTLEVALTAARRMLLAWRAARKAHASGQQMFAGMLAKACSGAQGISTDSDAGRVADVGSARGYGDVSRVCIWLDLPFTLLFLAAIHAIAGWLVAVPITLLAAGFGMALASDRRARRVADEAMERQRRQDSFVLETLGRLQSIKSAALEAPMMRRFERLLAGAGRVPHRAFAGQVAPTMIVVGCVVVVVAVGSPLVMAAQLGAGELIACTLLAVRAVMPAQSALIASGSPQAPRFTNRSVLSRFENPRADIGGATELQRLQGSITLDDVTLRLGAGAAPLFDRVSLQIPAGAMIGITGAVGSGKTTLLMLLAGQRRPDSGRVLLDGRFDPRDCVEDSVLRQVVYVPDHAPIFAGTLLENITMFAAAPGASLPAHARDRAYDLSERLGLLPLASRLPMGFNTKIGPGSAIPLPQGIAQRIALARAFFPAPRILLLDVANAALDPEADELLRRLLEEERGTCTMVVVSQRPSLLRLADKIYTLADGNLRSPSPSRYMAMVRQRVSA